MNGVDDDQNNAHPQHSLIMESLMRDVNRFQTQQGAWNEEIHRLFLTEAREKERSDQLTQQVQAAEALTREDDAFRDWIARRAESDLGENMIKKWYHIDGLVEKTPFVALVPCPRLLSPKGRRELVAAVDALHLQRFFVQTVPLHLPLSQLAPTFISLPFHIPKGGGVSKSNLGNLPYMGLQCKYGGDVLQLVSQYPLLGAALDQTPCLFLNDYVPRVALCFHVVTVGGRCVAAEVACDVRLGTQFGLDHAASGPERAEKSIEVLSLALKRFMERQMVPFLENRSFRSLVLGEIVSGQEPCTQCDQAPLVVNNLRFSLLNVDVLDGYEFECFKQDDILAIVRQMTQSHVENEALLPVLRFLRRHAEKTT